MEKMNDDLRRWLAIAISVAGLLICLQWMVAGHQPTSFQKGFLPVVLGLSSMALERYPEWAGVGIWLTAITAATACAMALYLMVKAPATEATLRLAFSLGAGGLALSYFYLGVLYPVGARPASEWPLPLAFAGDALGYWLFLLATWQLARVWEIFPQPISNAGWDRHVAAWLDATHRTMRAGWRGRLYPAALLPPTLQDPEDAEGRGIRNLMWRGMNAKRRAAFRARVLSPPFGAFLLLVAVACAGATWFVRMQLPGLPAHARVEGLAGLVGNMLPMFCIFFFGFGAVALGYSELEYHRKWGSDEDRRRIAWIYATVFASGTLFLALLLGSFLIFTFVVFFALDSMKVNLEPLLLFPLTAGWPLCALAIIVSIVLSVVYRGAIDPRLAARRITLWGLVGIVVAVLFVVFERAVAIRVTQWLSLPGEWGPLLAGALAAGTLAPVRSATEKAVNQLAERFLPPDAIATGERRRSVVALCDLSGYTALSGTDERKALLLAAILQQKASRIAAARHGRVVKSMGDAVLLDFADAQDACVALEELHAQVPVAASDLGLDPLPLHSGAHVGEVVVGPDGDIYGQTVNLAARLQGQAGDGEIVVSEALVAAAQLPAERVASMGARTLKNVSEPVACYRLIASAPPPVTGSGDSTQREAISR